MAGIRIEVGVRDFELRRAIQRARQRAEDPREALEASGSLIEGSTKERFETGVGPNGIPWPPSRRTQAAAVPKKRARKNKVGPLHGGKTLRDKGNLEQSIRWQLEGKDAVAVGVDGRNPSAKYAATHQFGAHITPKKGEFLVFTGADGGLVFARSVDIPARPFLGIDAQDERDLTDLWTDFAREPFE